MPDPRGFLKYARRDPEKEPAADRVRDFREVERRLPVAQAREQAARCMGCGVPFCHAGCPLGNAIPDWNDAVREDRWRAASTSLHATNNFPEITGRICPAPCEGSCVAGLGGDAVSIRAIERAIGDRGWDEGWIAPRPAERKTGRKVAIIGSGPAGLACAQQLARAGHDVTVFERDERAGGLLRYGIPDFKLDKKLVDARVRQLEAEGVRFETGVEVGRDVTIGALRASHAAVIVATGAGRPRDLRVPGRDLAGVHFAMDYLAGQNKALAGERIAAPIVATGKKVLVLGGGDTGADCVGTAHRQGAASVVQIELMPRPPEKRTTSNPWPEWPVVLRTSTSHEEGGGREWGLLTKRLVGDGADHVAALEAVHVAWADGKMREDGELVRFEADLVLLALGFLGPDPVAWRGGAVALDERGNVRAPLGSFATSTDGVFACGDARRGPSLVVWAIWEGREAARAVDAYLMGEARLASSPL